MKKELPTNWLNFYIFVRIPLTILHSIYLIFDCINNKYNYALCINIIYTLFLILLLLNAKNKNKIAYRMIIYSLFFDIIFYTINLSYPENFDSKIVLSCIIVSFVFWFIPNYEYFRKRKYIFSNEKANILNIKNNHNQDRAKKYKDLKQLKDLLDNNIITEEEFNKEKEKILNE